MAMDSLPFTDALIKEYLLFRGFTQTLQAFSQELSNDQGCGYQAERMTQLLFGRLIPDCSMNEVLEFLELLNSRLYAHLDSRYDATIRKLEQSIIKCLLVTAVKKKRKDKVVAFFHEHGDDLLHGPDGEQWRPWCALAFIPQPWQDPVFQAFFLPSWHQLLELSFHNFLTEVTARLPLPTILRFNTDRRLRLQLARQVEVLQQEVRHLDVQKTGQHSLSMKATRTAATQWPEESGAMPDNRQSVQHQAAAMSLDISEPQLQQPPMTSSHEDDVALPCYVALTEQAAAGSWQQQRPVVDEHPTPHQPSGRQLSPAALLSPHYSRGSVDVPGDHDKDASAGKATSYSYSEAHDRTTEQSAG